MPLHLRTPLLHSLPMSRRAGASVWLKMEALQPSGSFKLRGVGLACETALRQGARRFLSSSGGNAGLAVAHAARRLGVPATVVVPQSTPEQARGLIAEEAAEVVVHGETWQEANAHAQALRDAHTAFVHPFDDPLLWAGHASMIDEVAEDGLRPDAVVLSVGGGGLFCGVVEGLRRQGWNDVPVIAVETEGAASFHRALQAGHPVELERIDTVATTLGAKRVCERSVALAQEHPVRSLVVSDRAAVAACQRFLDEHRVLVEPACGAALSALDAALPGLPPDARVLAIVCGGAGVTAAQLQRLAEQTGAAATSSIGLMQRLRA